MRLAARLLGAISDLSKVILILVASFLVGYLIVTLITGNG